MKTGLRKDFYGVFLNMPERGYSAKDRAKIYRSICRVRKDCGLGCNECILKGYRECLESHGKGPNIKVQLADHTELRTPHGRDVTGYTLHRPMYVWDDL